MTQTGLTCEQVNRRAGGRRRYNAQRQQAAAARLESVWRLANQGHTQRLIGAALHVHASTISRDLKRLGLLMSMHYDLAEVARMTVHQVDHVPYKSWIRILHTKAFAHLAQGPDSDTR